MLRSDTLEDQEEKYAYHRQIFNKYPLKPEQEQIDYAERLEQNLKYLPRIE